MQDENWLVWLFSGHQFITRDHCGLWTNDLKWAYVVANAMIAAAYFAMPIAILILWKHRRHHMRYPAVLCMFAAFIALCGLTHVCDLLTFWWPAYRLYTAVSITTATVSVATACLLPLEIRYLLEIPLPEEWRRVNAELADAVAAREASIIRLYAALGAAQKSVDHLERMRRTGIWADKQQRELRSISALLDGVVSDAEAAVDAAKSDAVRPESISSGEL